MLLGNCVDVFLRRIPSALAHNQGDTLRGFDLPAPVFQFLIGASLVLFLAKRVRSGLAPREAQRAAVRRFALLIALGILLDGVGTLSWRLRWGVLQTLGLGGIVATLVAFAPAPAVAALAAVVLALYSGPLNGEVHASPFGAVAFVPLTLAGLLVGRALCGPRPYADGVRVAAATAAVAGTAALALYAAGVPFNKVTGTSSFVCLTTAVASGTVAVLAAIEALAGGLPRGLVEVGQNALNVWVLQYLLVYYPAWLLFPSWHRLRLVPGFWAIVGTTLGVSALGVALGRRGIRIPL
jgi:hypothetical protein